MPEPSRPVAASIRHAEIARFDALAAQWWNPRGPMRPLHAMNPARIGWIDTRLRALNLAGATVVDVGCGAGLAAEALARLGYEVLGIDAAPAPIAAACAHAPAGLPLAYRQASAEDLVAEGRRFGAVTALEVIEHVADPGAFVATLAALLSPGGAVFFSTLNRTPLSFLTAKLGAEYVLRLLPAGTHDYRRFMTPAELAAQCRAAGLLVRELTGLRPGVAGGWHTGRDLSVNYMVCAQA